MRSITVFLFATSLVAWGNEGHAIVADLASRLLTESAKQKVNDILGHSESLRSVASWADRIKNTGEYAWTRTLHYVDPLDNPSIKCEYDDDRDCKDGKCVVGAISKVLKFIDYS